MSLVVGHNPAGMNSARSLAISDRQLTTSLERLSSGRRINRAADDASNLALSEGLRTQIGGFKVALRNSQDGISVLQTAEGALTETQGLLHRMRDLTVQAANAGSLDDEARAAVQSEISGLRAELDRIATTTAFNGSRLLDGGYRTTFQVGAEVGQTLAVAIGTSMSAAGLGVDGVDVTGRGSYAFDPAVGVPAAGHASISTAAGTGSAAVLTFTAPAGTADFTGSASGAAAWTGLDGVVTFGGRALDLGAVSWDTTADSDGSGVVDSADLLSQLNAAARSALGLTSGPFTAAPATGALRFSVGEAVPGATTSGGAARSAGAADLAAATPRYTPATGAAGAIAAIDAAIATVSTVRGELGAVQNRFEHNIAKLGAAIDNTAASEARIRDTDMAQEMTAFSRSQILTQAGTAMLAQANQSPRGLLQLLS